MNMNILIFTSISNTRIFMERDTVLAKFALDTSTYRDNKMVDLILMYYMSEFSALKLIVMDSVEVKIIRSVFQRSAVKKYSTR